MSLSEAFQALAYAPFRRYFVGQSISASGTFVQQTAIGWAVLTLTGSATSLGAALAAGGVPFLLLGPLGGNLADHYDNRRLLLITQSSYGLLAGALWVAALAGLLSVPLIVAINLAGGFVQVVDSPTRQAFVGQLVPSVALGSAVSLNGALINSSRVVGPALAGILIVTTGTTACFAINAITYAVPVAVLALMEHTHADAARGTTRSGVRDAVRYVSRHQQLYLPLTMIAIVGVCAFNFNVILPTLASDVYDAGGGTYGLLATALSIGSVAGSLIAGALGHPRRQRLVAAALAFAGALALVALAPTVPIACAALVLAGLSGFVLVTTASTSLQVHAATAYRGRVMALWAFLYVGTAPVGNLAAGWLSERCGPRSPLVIGAVSCLVAAALAARVETPPHVDDLGLD